MAMLQVRDLSFSYGGRDLLENITFQVEAGERIGLLGRNGAGKSTLMKLLIGELKPDHGSIELQAGVRMARLAQEVPTGEDHTAYDEVALGLGSVGENIRQLHRLSLNEDHAQTADEFAAIQERVGLDQAWKFQHQVENTIDRMQLPAEALFASLSSGMKRRVLLAKALVTDPEILLLDEPTNHLDIEAVTWLEDFLLRSGLTLIFVTHDRQFLQRLATRIIEVERARLFDWTCDFATFLVRKEEALEGEARQQALFDKKLAAEEVWVRTGIKARRTRNEGRVRALERMRVERQQRREKTGTVRMTLQDVERSGHIVAQLTNVTHRYSDDGREVLKNATIAIDRGDKVGIIGPNGAGKSTLLKILLGQLKPTEGNVRLGTNLQVAYFDQLRDQLDEEKTAIENVGGGNDTVTINGQSRHIIGYLSEFLFSGERARSLVRYLSGGERNRLLLAKLFTKPANVLVLDEPTNDLDAETLELLEALLVEFSGTVLMVSHDRAFLNNVVTSTLVFEGNGTVRDYAGGYDDWVRQRDAALATAKKIEEVRKAEAARTATAPAKPAGRKLSFKEQRELEELPEKIDVLEAKVAEIDGQLSDPAVYSGDGKELARLTTELAQVNEALEAAFERWTELESMGPQG